MKVDVWLDGLPATLGLVKDWHGKGMTKKRIRCAAAAGLLLAAGPMDWGMAAEEEVAKDIIAIQIKRQGYACDRPEEAKRDAALSKPDSVVWLLKCESGTYRVRLVPDMQAHVERID
jgi:hypothetical protein